MFSFFKQSQSATTTKTKERSIQEVVAEIHDTFYTEVNRLLESSKIMSPEDTTMQDLIDKRDRLVSLGFTGTKEVMEAEVEIARLKRIKEENNNKETLIEAINYFSQKYPLYKFITEESVQRICGKYNLIYGEASRYKGTVPDKNLADIERFKIDDEDKAYLQWYSFGVRMFGFSEPRKEVVPYERHKSNMEVLEFERQRHLISTGGLRSQSCPLEIAAPKSDFNTEGMELNGFKLQAIEVPDPIVLQPVFYGGMKHYLVVTAWGLEAGDEDVVNQRMN